MSLIAGMDNVVEYIKKLEQENKKLKEENEELTWKNKLQKGSIKRMCDIHKKEKAENTILTNYRNCMDKIQKEFNDIEDIVDVLPFMKSMKEKNNKMKDMLLKFKKNVIK